MGLDVTAYRTATILPDHPRGECTSEDCFEGHVRAYIFSGEMARSLRGLEEGSSYDVSGESFSFGAGGYSFHIYFRDSLSVAALGVSQEHVYLHRDEYEDKPFFELLVFSDAVGTIGPEAAADLAADFHSDDEIRRKLVAVEASFVSCTTNGNTLSIWLRTAALWTSTEEKSWQGHATDVMNRRSHDSATQGSWTYVVTSTRAMSTRGR